MKVTLEERVRKKLLKFGRKNRICGVLVIPVLAVCLFFFHALNYGRDNAKRLVMMAMTFCLIVMYSSFSFPMYIVGNGESDPYGKATDSDVELAPESEINLEEVRLLTDEEILEEYGTETDADGVDKYDASQILASLEGHGRQSGHTQGFGGEKADESVFSKDDWRLVLINKQHSIPDDYTFTLVNIVGSMKCDERILDDLVDMFQAAKDDGITLEIRSPYRTHERQVWLFERKITMYMNMGMSYMEAYQLASQAVTLPGNSEHEVGLALDIECVGYVTLDEGFGDTHAGKWLAENSCKYGFILRYPKGKEYVTGIEYEPWHFRYVGAEAAMVITQKGITLEEFWEDL